MLTDEQIADMSCRDVDMGSLLRDLDEWYTDVVDHDPCEAGILTDVIEIIQQNLS